MFKNVLTIAGFDGSGGAGIQADLKTFAALGCHGLSVLTALPIQNTQGVRSIYPIDAPCVTEQLHCLADDIEIHAIKLGMLYQPSIVEEVAKFLDRFPQMPIVFDPVLVATSNDSLVADGTIESIRRKLLPRTSLLTPNAQEAAVIGTAGPKAVVITGGDGTGQTCDDCFLIDGDTHWLSAPRIATKNTHGTGCTFSAACAAYLAQGLTLQKATIRAKDYVTRAIRGAVDFHIGQGNGPVHHFFNWEVSDEQDQNNTIA